jgi:hypothetical protein
LIQRAGEFLECTIDVGQRQNGESTETVGTRPNHLGEKVVAPVGESAGRSVVAEMNSRGADRGDRHVDARIVHERQRASLRPRRGQHTAHRLAVVFGGAPVEIRYQVMVDINRERHGVLLDVAGGSVPPIGNIGWLRDE